MVHFSSLPFNPDYINRLSIIHRPCSSLLFPDHCRLIVSLAFHMFEPVFELNGQDVPPPPSEGFSTHLMFLSEPLRLSATGSFIPLAPTCTTFLSTSDYLSHLASPPGTSAIKCKPARAVGPTRSLTEDAHLYVLNIITI